MPSRVFVFSKTKTATFRVYEIETSGLSIEEKRLQGLAELLFADPVAEHYAFDGAEAGPSVIVWFKKGVYDAEGDMALYAAKRLGLDEGIERVHFGRGFKKPAKALLKVQELYNPLIETVEKIS
ncbi:MAG: hypothetical protein HYT79_00340 [Elusimicrobia bacterium]|nr:hypothetical protein [Elusimicrobiota bacterium]